MARPKLLTRNQLIDRCRELYEAEGFPALTYASLKKHGLYFNLYNNGISQRDLLQILGLSEQFREHRNQHWQKERDGKTLTRWTWERIQKEAMKSVADNGFLPPAAWFQANSRGSLVAAVYALGKTWADVRAACDCFQTSNFVQSRNGMRWRSHPEASLSNFLYARGIAHKLGRKYPSRFSLETNLAYGYYDLAFLSKANEWVDVEIWGDKPNGHDEEYYGQKRSWKEEFNKSNANYLGIEFRDCYSEDRLSVILKPYVGIVAPYIFEKPSDHLIPSTHWSNADELLDFCREFAQQQPDGKFPTEEWLRKRGKWKDRPGPAYNTLAIYVRVWIGGVRKLREILGQPEHSTQKWDRETALAAYREWYAAHGRSPASMRKMHQRGKLTMTEPELKIAANIAHACRKYVGNTEQVHTMLGLPLSRKSPQRRPRFTEQA